MKANFLTEMGSHTLFQRGSRRKGFRGWSGVVVFAMDSRAFSGELVWFAPLLGR
jgi:hypothetical protein